MYSTEIIYITLLIVLVSCDLRVLLAVLPHTHALTL